jgi:hypothetical protein
MTGSRSILNLADRQGFPGNGYEEIFEGVVFVFLRESAGVAFEENLTLRQKQDTMADFGNLNHVVRGPEDSDISAFSEPADGGANFAGNGGIKGRGGFIEEKQTWLVEHGFGESDAGLLAGGENATFGVAKSEEIELVEDILDALAQPWDGIEHAEDAEVLRDSEIAGKRGIDSCEVRAAEGLAAMAGEVAAVDGDGARCGLENAEDHVDGCGFAGPVGAEEPEDFMGTNLKGQTVNGNYGAVLLAQVGDRQDGLRSRHLCERWTDEGKGRIG